jgi:hypothetical protein
MEIKHAQTEQITKPIIQRASGGLIASNMIVLPTPEITVAHNKCRMKVCVAMLETIITSRYKIKNLVLSIRQYA